jgi:DNA processing protein
VTISSTELNPGAPGYPARLTGLGFAPTLYVRGALCAEAPAVAIVGARAASRIGMDRAHAAARHVADRGVRVVSGGALGIDGAAHRGALASTVVLGSGTDVAYPARHAGLFDQILAAGGALASLLPDGSQPRRGTFPQRNPVIAALADIVVVVEADLHSGSLSTARAARELGRLVVAYPGTPGCDRLLATGAAMAEGPDDVLSALAGSPRMPRALDPELARIRAAVASGTRGVDALVAATGLSVRAVLRALPLIERYS